eukprot:Skav225281  [mRNA]  locus=scaffold4099:214090:235123:+ [translate_table: standard]
MGFPKGKGGCRYPEFTHKGGYRQIKPQVPQWPQTSDIFEDADDMRVVEFPRVLDEPSVRCPHNHTVHLSRLPYQSACAKCKDQSGWPQYMIRDYYRHLLGVQEWPYSLRLASGLAGLGPVLYAQVLRFLDTICLNTVLESLSIVDWSKALAFLEASGQWPVQADEVSSLADFGRFGPGYRRRLLFDANLQHEKDDFLLVSDQITRSDPYELWAALDYDKTGYVSLREISEEKVPHPTSHLARFLDHWRPPAYLIAEPNQEAADQIRSLLLSKYGHFLKAWRTLLDKANVKTNLCLSAKAMKCLKFHGDVGGAWLALDKVIHWGYKVIGTYSYATIAPGPGAYDLLSCFGAQPRVPMARQLPSALEVFQGPQFSFGSRRGFTLHPLQSLEQIHSILSTHVRIKLA